MTCQQRATESSSLGEYSAHIGLRGTGSDGSVDRST